MDIRGSFTIRGQPGTTGQVPTRQGDGSVAWQAPGDGSAAGLVRIDSTSTANTLYVGKALAGTNESATGWTIKRTTYSALGVRLTGPLTAAGVWANRTSLTYS